MKKLLFMLAFNLSTASTAYSRGPDPIGEKCANLASESGSVCALEKEEIAKTPVTDDARSFYKACMKGFVRQCRAEFEKE